MDNIFYSSVNVTERLQALRDFTADQCRHALNNHPSLQASVRKALESRLRRLNKEAPSFDPSRAYKTSEILNPAMHIKDQASADKYFEALVDYIMKHFGRSRISAESKARADLGLIAGYFDEATRKRVYRLFAPRPHDGR